MVVVAVRVLGQGQSPEKREQMDLGAVQSRNLDMRQMDCGGRGKAGWLFLERWLRETRPLPHK